MNSLVSEFWHLLTIRLATVLKGFLEKGVSRAGR